MANDNRTCMTRYDLYLMKHQASMAGYYKDFGPVDHDPVYVSDFPIINIINQLLLSSSSTMRVTSLAARADSNDSKDSKNSKGKKGSSAGVKSAGDGLPSNAKPAGQYQSSYDRWMAQGNIALYDTLSGGTSGTEELPPIPAEWIIAPKSNNSVLDGRCPTIDQTTNSFLISDAVSGFVAIFICCRPILKKITFGFFGTLPNKDSRCCSSVWYSWLVSFLMTFLGNLFASLVVKRTEGYDHLYFATIFALYTSRPRINLALVALLRVFITVPTSDWSSYMAAQKEKEREKEKEEERGTKPSSPRVNLGHEFLFQFFVTMQPRNWSSYLPANKGKEKEEHSMEPSGLLLAAADNGGDESASDTDDTMEPLEREYVYLDSYRSTFIAEMVLNIIAAVFVGDTWKRFPNEDIKKHMKFQVSSMCYAPIVLAVTAVWCPPKLPIQTSIWTAFSVIGNLLAL
ncbi:hypothetical protein CGLO_00558 [Colletotrichum gloeosporioides Cg-14]|uniref:Uncharacterized protein n=1 Tax=Colletotrichum gloeosporioides (strain Cg-14) TaxID=1237896 RepID=T0M6L4_COLGC|nr:hypothetical protein CGLO_00558 [Colletotrichum gloeosporioides Cg-14]